MASNDRAVRDPRRAWVIVGMMVIFMLINFADKAVIGLAAGPIIRDLHLTNEQFGQIGSAFFLLFSISAALVGFLVNRVPTKIVLVVMAFIWALTQLPMLGLVSLPVLAASRVVLGAGEGPAYPVALHAVYKWFPNDSRAFPTGFVSIGGPLGIGLAAPLLTWIILTYSWHAAFGFLGVSGLIWVVIWLVVGKEGPLDAHQVEAGGAGLEYVPYSALLMSRTFIGVTLAGFAAYWAVTLAVVWLPSFLIRAAGYSPTATGWIVMLPPILQLCLSPTLGFISQKLRALGVSSRVSRGVLTSACVTVAGVAMTLLSKSAGELAQIPLVMMSFAVASVTFALGPPLVGEISPVRQRGAMLGISNGLFTLAGLVAPWLMGHIVDVGANPAQGFRDGFMFAGLLIVAGGLLAMILINPESDQARFGRRGPAIGGEPNPDQRPALLATAGEGDVACLPNAR
ncbi:MFS transporter [Bradyrhizobium sp. ARR65]|uniref:MFS transporter n=1 Tax=Bradyrhizobium sp. ARR65 TaxID=1040989 RepID=UPI00046363B5|nr:MFS transporter [Bradyrhizobium sp. ARR65]